MSLFMLSSRPRAALAVAAAALAVVAPLTAAGSAPASAAGSTSVVGADVSWPECPSTMGIPGKKGENKPMPPASSRFVVLGLTDGPAFFRNPCLRREVRWAKRHRAYTGVYAVSTYPFPRELARYGSRGPYSARTVLGRLRNVGFQQAKFNVATMRDAGVSAPAIWIDVEDSSLRVWPHAPVRNRAVFRGLLSGYGRAGLRVGVYSSGYYWSKILGDVRYGLPEWRTAGQASMSAALGTCSRGTFNGGRAVMAQWWTSSKDFDVMCPGHGSQKQLRRWFHKY